MAALNWASSVLSGVAPPIAASADPAGVMIDAPVGEAGAELEGLGGAVIEPPDAETVDEALLAGAGRGAPDIAAPECEPPEQAATETTPRASEVTSAATERFLRLFMVNIMEHHHRLRWRDDWL